MLVLVSILSICIKPQWYTVLNEMYLLLRITLEERNLMTCVCKFRW